MGQILDKQDLNILHKLDKNSRASIATIGKAARLPTETVRYRIQRLCENKIIDKFHSIIDLSKLGCTLYKIYLGLQNATEDEIKNLISNLDSVEGVIWIIRTNGKFDLALGLIVNEIMVLDSFLENLNSKFSKLIRKRSICINVSMNYLERDYLVKKKSRESSALKHYSAKSEKANIDDLDLMVIEKISEDSRIAAAQLARDLTKNLQRHISTEVILNRIKKLEKQELITGYSIILNNESINQLHIKVLLHLSAYTPEKMELYVRHCRKIPRIIRAIKVIGEWDYELDLEVENTTQYREIMGELTSAHPDLIRDYNALFIEQVIKYKAVEFNFVRLDA